MLDSLRWLFLPDMAHGVFWGSFLVTFVASVMGKDQQQRLEQGKFGLAAGTSLGGISALLKDQKELLVVGFVGSAVGGLLGWLYYLALAFVVTKSKTFERLLSFQIGGLEGLQTKLDVQSKENLAEGFEIWSGKLSRMIAEMKDDLLRRRKEQQPHWEDEAIMVIRCWLTVAVDTLALVFGTLANHPEYQSRVTIVIFRLDADNDQAVGKHWTSYSGQLQPHSAATTFDKNSIGYKVLARQLPSPYFITNEIAEKKGQSRADASYRNFVTFRLTESAVMSVDWPDELKKDDPYVKSAQSLFDTYITPAITEVLDQWPRPLVEAAQLESMPTPVYTI